MSTLAALPLLIPLAGTIVCILCWRLPRTQRVVSFVGVAGLAFVSAELLGRVSAGSIEVAQVSAWIAPFGITIAVDLLGALFVLATAIVAFLTLLYGFGEISSGVVARGYYPVFNALLLGVNGAFCTGDLFNMYVWFEVLLMSSFVLMTIQGDRTQLRAGITYVLINLLSSTCFLTALGLLYAQLGTLNIAHLTASIGEIANGSTGADASSRLMPIATLLCLAFAIKAALFPFFFWLPGTYPTPPSAIAALFAGLLTKVGVYSLLRVFGMIFTPLVLHVEPLVFGMALFSIVVGALGAAAAGSARRAFSFSIVGGVGLACLGLALGTTAGLTAAIFYSFQSMVMTAVLFLLAGAVRASSGADHVGSALAGGLWIRKPLLALFFVCSVFSLAGIPPLPGFVGKLLLLQSAVALGSAWPIAIVALAGLITLLAVALLWAELFWRKPEQELAAETKCASCLGLGRTVALSASAVALALLVLYANRLVELSQAAAASLRTPTSYISAVLPHGVPQALQQRIYIHRD